MVGIPGIKGEAGEVSQMAVFNVKFLSLSPKTRTDSDAEASIRLVGHELFHMWLGECGTARHSMARHGTARHGTAQFTWALGLDYLCTFTTQLTLDAVFMNPTTLSQHNSASTAPCQGQDGGL